ncbi:MAG: glycosyltransferase [Bacteroidales bacterium]
MKRVLVAPLNWGLGHATRCVPLIEKISALGAEVVLAGYGAVYDFFLKRFPDYPLILLPDHIVSYQARGRQLMLPVIKGLPGYALSLYREHQALHPIIKKYSIGFVVSDNRYGMWHPEVPSVLITHQINIRVNGLWKAGTPLLRTITQWFFSHFQEIWIPDFPSWPGLAGQLSHPQKPSPHFRYIGPLSRFKQPAPVAENPTYDFLALLSGPEPQRTILENIFIRIFLNGPGKTILLRGIPGNGDIIQKSPYLTLVPHLSDDELFQLIRQSRQIICRSGYSSLMDLYVLQRGAVLVPTPGQPEQEYLARLHNQQPGFRVFTQQEIEVLGPEDLIASSNETRSTYPDNSSALEDACHSILLYL